MEEWREQREIKGKEGAGKCSEWIAASPFKPTFYHHPQSCGVWMPEEHGDGWTEV